MPQKSHFSSPCNLNHTPEIPRNETKEIMMTSTTPQGIGIDDPGDDIPFQPSRYKVRTSPAAQQDQVGAFAVTGIGATGGASSSWSGVGGGSVSSMFRPQSTRYSDDITDIPIVAHVVDEEKPSWPVPIFDATPMDEVTSTEPQNHMRALLKNRKCRILSILTFTLFVGMMVAVVLLTKNRSTELSLPAKTLLADIKPLLSNESLTALDDPDSPQSLSLRWLLERSNFEAWPFPQQVQRYAMATFYYATGGPSWSNGGANWLTDESECTWLQGGMEGNFCTNGTSGSSTLVILNQSNNTLNGKLPNDIGLLTSLTVIDLSVNKLYQDIPTDTLKHVKALQALNLSMNEFSGNVPDDIVHLSSLTVVDLSANKMKGTIPIDVMGKIKSLQVLDLSNNMFTGTLTSSSMETLTSLHKLDVEWTFAL